MVQDKKHDVKKELENRFLFEDDVDALYLLLSIIDNEKSFTGLRPKYVSMEKIIQSVKSGLSYRSDKNLIARAISKLINDDVNKLELAYYIGAYTTGYEERTYCNQIEFYILRHNPSSRIINSQQLLHKDQSKKVLRLKKNIVKQIINQHEILSSLESFTEKYCHDIMLDKIVSLNEILDKQLMISEKGKAVVITEERFITNWQLEKLYHRIVASYIRSLKQMVQDAVWYGLNDRVLERYK